MRDRRVLGQELLEFIDGTTKEVTIYAVSNYEVLRAGRMYKKISYTSQGLISNVVVEEEELILDLVSKMLGSQVTKEDLKEVNNDLKQIYQKYMELNSQKKEISTDTLEQQQDNL